MAEISDNDILNLYSKAPIEKLNLSQDNKPLSDNDILKLYSKKDDVFKNLTLAQDEKISQFKNTASDIKQGVNDVFNAVGTGIGFIDKNLNSTTTINPQDKVETKGSGVERNRLFQERVQSENEAFKSRNEGEESTLGRTAGQALTTIPLTPVGAFGSAAGLAGKALPQIIKGPIINKLGSVVATGGLAGGEFGALTSTSNQNSLASNIGQGLITGAIAAPVVAGAGAAVGKAINAGKSLWEHLDVNKLAKDAGMNPSSVKDVITHLDNAGFTPLTAQAALTKLGPNATLGDLDEALTTEVRGLSQMGGKTTSILKERYKNRALGANETTRDLMDNLLGRKPDIDLEKKAIDIEARKMTGPDYNTAHTSTQKLDLSPLVSDIDKQLETAVGDKANALKTAKSYLFSNTKDASGDSVSTLKSDVASLHEARQGIDDIINKRSESLPPNALRAINGVRDAVDKELKTVPEMARADTKFSEKMGLKDQLQYGHDIIAKPQGNSIERFKRLYDAATPEEQDYIRKGMRSAIGDIMDTAQRGEYEGAQRALGKKSINREMMKYAFGSTKAETVLDALQHEATERAVERTVLQGSNTAANQAVMARRGGITEHNPSIMGEAAKGAMFDVLAGTPAVAATISAVRRGGQNTLLNLSKNRLNALNEGSADILSRGGSERDNALDILDKVTKIQSKSLVSRQSNRIYGVPTNRLPISISSPIGEETYKKLNGEK